MDRNDAVQVVIVIMHASLSARRAWIEIALYVNGGAPSSVALRKESVDRNGCGNILVMSENRRSPQGERG